MQENTSFPILMFHRVGDEVYYKQTGIRLSGESQSRENFKKKLLILQKDFKVRPLIELVHNIRQNEPIPRNSAAITFDDGTRDQVKVALPILKELGLTATFFVTTAPFRGIIPPTFKMQLITGGKIAFNKLAGSIFPKALRSVSNEFFIQYKKGIKVPDNRFVGEQAQQVREMKYLVNYLMPALLKNRLINNLFEMLFPGKESEICEQMFVNVDDVKDLVNAGMDIGSHSDMHFNLATLSPKEAIKEVVGCKELLQNTCGIRPKIFSFPSGGNSSYTKENVELVKKCFEAAVITGNQKEWVRPGVRLYELPRLHEKYL